MNYVSVGGRQVEVVQHEGARSFRVRATELGFYGGYRRRAGAMFFMRLDDLQKIDRALDEVSGTTVETDAGEYRLPSWTVAV